MRSFRTTLHERLKDSEFKAEYEALEPEFQLIRSLLEARKVTKLTQEELSARTGISQADISRIETGEANPSMQTMKRLAEGLGMQLRVMFVPQNAHSGV